ncbi:MAG TPA: tripartite tricarboxylate transporter substrate binding protein [Hyphomicrobiaceae bacterium]|nr:tripartite tricarboxylate transporter substrate binding protein [Hyphomicrobiaceae bacterium]
MDRRHFLAGTAATAAFGIGPSLVGPGIAPAAAQDAYPSRAITFINPFPPGGAADVVARPLASVLEPILKQPIAIETKAGAAGAVGAQYAAAAKPDGYTILIHIVSLSGFAEVDRLYGRPVKFTNADFIPIARFIADPMALVVNDKQPFKTLKEFVDAAKAKPNELIFSSSGLHGALHLPMALFLQAAGIKLRHLPTNGGGPALTALIGNNAQALCSSIAAAAVQMKAGKARALACFGAQRSPALPDVPTLKELGYNVEFYLWVGMFAPKGTPEAAITVLRDAARKAAADETFIKAMKNIGQDVAYLDQPEFRAFWEADAKRVEEAVRQIGKV